MEHSNERKTLGVLLDLTKTLVGDLSLDVALRAVTDAALQLLPGEHASVRVLDRARQNLLSGARSGSGAEQGPMQLKRGEGMSGWVAEHGKPVRSGQVAADERFKVGDRQGFSIESMLVVPLESAGHVVGVLGVTSPKPDAFTEDHEMLAMLLANCAVPAIQKARLRRLRKRAERLALTDAQTLAYNQRYLFPRLRQEIDRAHRYVRPLSIVLLDLDEFKEVNDAHGHAAGDRVLHSFTQRVLSCVRTTDVLIRRGGDEFVLVMPDTDEQRAAEVAERIRAAVADDALDPEGTAVALSVSVGVATWISAENAEQLEHRADVAMYEAKRQGRNRVVAAAVG